MAPSVTEIIDELTHLPANVNPFQWLDDFLRTSFIPQYSETAKAQLYVIISLHAACASILVVSLALRYRRNQLWLFRWQLSRTLIEPNLATVPACAAIVEIALFEVLLIGMEELMGGRIPRYYGYTILCVGVLPAIVGELVTWSIAAGFIIHCHKTVGSTRNVRRWSIVCNVAGISIPLVHLGGFLPINVLVGKSYARAIEDWQSIATSLDSEAAKWSPSTVNDGSFLTALIPIVGTFQSLQVAFLKLSYLWKVAYTFHAVAAILLILTLGSIATAYLRSVQKIISRGKQEVSETGRGGETLFRVQQTWTLLVVVLSMFLILASFSFGLSLYASTHPLETPQTYVFTSFWSSAILTIICSSLLLLQTLYGGGGGGGGRTGNGDSIDRENGGKSTGQGRTVGFALGSLPKTTARRTNRGGKKAWWPNWFGRHEQEEKSRAPARPVGVGSISVLVEVFSRVDSIEEDVEEISDELKPRWPDVRIGE